MTGKVEISWVAPQDPFYGLSEENIVPRITRSNWNRKAILRQDRRGVLYVFVEKIATMEGKKRQTRFYVSVHRLTGRERKDGYGGVFETLEEAIQHANGEDGSAFAEKTRPADLDTPIEPEVPPIIVSVGGVGIPLAASRKKNRRSPGWQRKRSR
jgi:hypothetical protein